MKKITQERCLQTIARIQGVMESKTKDSGDIIAAAATVGIKEVFGQDTEFDRKKLGLEMNLHDVDLNINSFSQVMKSWRSTLSHYLAKQDKVSNIALNCDVSALTLYNVTIGDTTILTWGQVSGLILTRKDIGRLGKEAIALTSLWADTAISNGLGIYIRDRQTDQWEPSSVEEAKVVQCLFDWAQVRQSKFYTSPSMMQKQGYDCCRRHPELEDDKLEWEIHIVFGNGQYMDDPDQEVWFCASNGVPSY